MSSLNENFSRLPAALIELAAEGPGPDDVETAFGHGHCHSPKEALKRFVGRLAINADDKVVYTGTSFLVPAAEDWTCLVLRAHGEPHLRPHATCLKERTTLCFSDHEEKAWDNGGVRDRDHSIEKWKLCLRTRHILLLLNCA